MQYIPKRLNGFIKNIWEVNFETSVNYRILPDGAIYLVFNLSPNFGGVEGELIQNGFNSTRNFCFLSGLQIKPIHFCAPHYQAITIEMSPIASMALFGLPCCELKNHTIDGDLILNDLNKVEDKLRSPITFIEKARWLENYLYIKINENSELKTVIKMRATFEKVRNNLQAKNKINIKDLTGYSRRHVDRLSTQWLGLPPTQHIRLHQFVIALEDLHHSSKNYTHIAANNGFYDQTHFNRSFREYTDMSPGQYAKVKSTWAGHIIS